MSARKVGKSPLASQKACADSTQVRREDSKAPAKSEPMIDNQSALVLTGPEVQSFRLAENASKAYRAAGSRRRAAEVRARESECRRAGDAEGARLANREATELEGLAADEERVLVPLVTGPGGEVTVADPAPHDLQGQLFRNTLDSPQLTAVCASTARMDLAENVGKHCLVQAIDAAETIQARDSIERMAAHQLAAAHEMAMETMAKGMKLIKESERRRDSPAHFQMFLVEGGRLLNAAARLMAAFQNGHATLARIRQGGRQVVTVQHVTVADGGQAVVAGQVTGGRVRGEGKT